MLGILVRPLRCQVGQEGGRVRRVGVLRTFHGDPIPEAAYRRRGIGDLLFQGLVRGIQSPPTLLRSHVRPLRLAVGGEADDQLRFG